MQDIWMVVLTAVASFATLGSLVVSFIIFKHGISSKALQVQIDLALGRFREDMRNELREMFTDRRVNDIAVQTLKEDMTAVRVDVAAVKEDVHQLDHRTARNSAQVTLVLETLLNHRGAIARIQEKES